MSYEAFKYVGQPSFAKITKAACEAFPGVEVVALVSPRVFAALAADLHNFAPSPQHFVHKPHRIQLLGCPEIYVEFRQPDEVIVLVPASGVSHRVLTGSPCRMMTEVTLA